MNRLLATSLLLVLAACGGTREPVGPAQPIDTTLTLAPGQATTVAGSGGLGIRFDAVTEDSRCPMDAMCVWAGRAGVRLTVTGTEAPAAVEIRSDPADARTASAGDVRIEWRELQPYPSASRPTQPADYRLTVRVTR